MTGKYRFRSEAQGSDYSAVNKLRVPVSRDMNKLIALLQEEANSKESAKLEALLQKAIDAKTASVTKLDDASATKLADSVTSLGKELKSFIKEQGKEKASNGQSISERIAALNMESMQRKQILALLKGIKDAQIDEFEPAGKSKRGGKEEERDDLHKETKRNLLYNFLGPAGPLVKIWTDSKDEYKKWREQTAEAKEANDRESEELAEAETDLEKKQDKKVDKLADHTENRLKDLDKRVTALEEGEGGEGSDSDRLSRRRKSKWFRKTRVMAKRRWRLMKRAMKRRLRVTRVMGKRRFRLMRNKAIRAAKARARQLRILAKRKLRLSWRKLKKTKVGTAASRALRRLRASKAGRWLRKTWRKGGPLLNKARGWASRGWGAAKGLPGKGKAAVGGVSNFISKFKGLAGGAASKGNGLWSKFAGKGKGLWANAAGAVKGSSAVSKVLGFAGKHKGLIGKISTKLGGKSLAKLIPVAGSLLSIHGLATVEEAKDTDDVVDKALAYGGGALDGATLGATIGSIVPGIGTAIGAVVGGVLGAAWVGIRRNWGTIKEWAKKGWELVKTGAAKAWEGAQALGKKYKEFMTGLWDIGANILKKLVSWLPAPVAKMLGLDQGAGADASGGGGGGGGTADPSIPTTDSGGGGGVGGAISDAVDWVKGEASAAVSAVANSDTGKAAAAAYGEAKGVVSRGYEQAKQGISNLGDVAYDTAKGAKNALALALGFQGSSTINGLNEAQTRAYVGNTMLTESGGKQGVVNSYGYIGQYQFGADALADNGLVDAGKLRAAKKAWGKGWYKGGHQAFMQDNSNWKIEGGQAAFLANKKLQDDTFVKYTNRNLAGGMRSGAINANSPPEQIAAYAKAAHLKGVGGANNLFVRGLDSVDANGTSARAYADGAAKSMSKLSAQVAAATQGVSKDSQTNRTSQASQVTRTKYEASADGKTKPRLVEVAKGRDPDAPEQKEGSRGMAMAKAVPTTDNLKRTTAPQTPADATAYTRVAATSPQANVTVNPPPAPKAQEEKPGMFASAMSAIGGALGIRDVPMVLGDNHMVVLNSGMVGA